MVGVSKLIWNLKQLVRNAFPQGLPVASLEIQYEKYFREKIVRTPNSVEAGCTNWAQVIKKSAKFRKWFRLDKLRRIKALPIPERDLKAYFKLVRYSNYRAARLLAQESEWSGLSESESEANNAEVAEGQEIIDTVSTRPTRINLLQTFREDPSTTTSDDDDSDCEAPSSKATPRKSRISPPRKKQRRNSSVEKEESAKLPTPKQPKQKHDNATASPAEVAEVKVAASESAATSTGIPNPDPLKAFTIPKLRRLEVQSPVPALPVKTDAGASATAERKKRKPISSVHTAFKSGKAFSPRQLLAKLPIQASHSTTNGSASAKSSASSATTDSTAYAPCKIDTRNSNPKAVTSSQAGTPSKQRGAPASGKRSGAPTPCTSAPVIAAQPAAEINTTASNEVSLLIPTTADSRATPVQFAPIQIPLEPLSTGATSDPRRRPTSLLNSLEKRARKVSHPAPALAPSPIVKPLKKPIRSRLSSSLIYDATEGILTAKYAAAKAAAAAGTSGRPQQPGSSQVPSDPDLVFSQRVVKFDPRSKRDILQHLSALMQPAVCGVCTASMGSLTIRAKHYNGNRHKEGLRNWLTDNGTNCIKLDTLTWRAIKYGDVDSVQEWETRWLQILDFAIEFVDASFGNVDWNALIPPTCGKQGKDFRTRLQDLRQNLNDGYCIDVNGASAATREILYSLETAMDDLKEDDPEYADVDRLLEKLHNEVQAIVKDYPADPS